MFATLTKRWLVLGLFLGMTGGMALPYAQVYQQIMASKFSCHCCSGQHGCAHCEAMGHIHAKKQTVTAQQSSDWQWQAPPCHSDNGSDRTIDFTQDVFIIPPGLVIAEFLITHTLQWPLGDFQSPHAPGLERPPQA